MRRGLLFVAIAASVPVALAAVRSGAAEPVVRDCVGRDLSPLAWSGDGRWLAFSRRVGSKAFVLTLVDLKTGRFRALGRSEEAFGISWSPVGATLLAASAREIYAGRPTGRLRLVAGGCFGAWSPKGKRIAFATGGWVITSNPDGGTKKRIVRADGVQSWSPDGRRLALVHSVPVECRPTATSNLRVSVYRFRGLALRRLTGDRRPFPGVARYRGDQWAASWSSDGRWLAYAEAPPCAEGYGQFDEEPETFLAGRRERVGVGVPTWAPSRPLLLLGKLFFGATRTVVTPGGRQLMYILLGRDFAWSADSTRIAFARGVRESASRLRDDVHVVVIGAGEQPKEIARSGRSPAWSPDGSRVAFVRTTENPFPCRDELHVVPSGGGEPRRLVGC
jgi:Tol biopolymer transport system component